MKKPSLLAVLAALLLVAPGFAHADDPASDAKKQEVLGIGGLFFRSEDPKRLSAWYEEHLGISPAPISYEHEPWHQAAGPTVFAPFNKDTTYFGRQEQSWMVNFRVADLKAMVAQLRAASISVEEPRSHPNGEFARLYDPEGNPIELWEFREPQ